MMRRREVIAGGMALWASAALPALAAEARMPLWPAEPPGGGGPIGPVDHMRHGALRHIARPWMRIHRPARPNGAAMLVAAGGGYRRIEMGREADPAAAWLAARGITAFTLAYRLPGEGWQEGPEAPLQDALRALRLIRAGAGRMGLDPARIGVLGFSAGAHLMGMAATCFDRAPAAPLDAFDHLSARPATAALIYPVITLEPPYDHTSSRKQLIGAHPSARQSAEWSVQTHVRRGDPAMFLVQAADDPISNPANSAIMEEACQQADVPVVRHLLPSGGHGFGMGRAAGPTRLWPGWYESWLSARGTL